MLPSLPQNDTPSQQQQRRTELAQQQQAYVYNFNTRLAPLGIVTNVPRQDEYSFVSLDGIATTFLQLLGNVLAIGAKLFNNGQSIHKDTDLKESELQRVEGLYQELSEGFSRLSVRVSRLHQAPNSPGAAAIAGVIERPRALLKAAGQLLEETAGIALVSELAATTALDAPSLASSSSTPCSRGCCPTWARCS